MARPVVRMAALSVLLLGGLSSAILAATGRPGSTTSTPVGATTSPATTTSPTTTSSAATVLLVTGHGWGHGLGLSEWGARGYAQHGWTYDEILAHYYTGTTLGPAPLSTVRVQLADAKRVTLSSTVAWTVTDATGAKTPLDPGPLTLTPQLSLPNAQLTPPLTFASAKPIGVGGHAYRGRLVAVPDGKKLEIVDVVGLEAYVKGVVPAEMPSGWPAEALKAQAVAARSYALANLAKGAGFDLYADTRSQVYGGVAAESPAASAAVDATRGQVVLYGDKVADALFFSTSGGRTATAADATGHAVPYLVSVADPYDTGSPYHDWGPVLVDAGHLAKILQLPGPPQDMQAVNGADGRVRRLTVVGPFGAQANLTGEQVRLDLGLRSTWFTIGLLSLTPPAKPMTYGGAATLTGLVRGLSGVTLESRAGTGPWLPAGTPVVTNGAFTLLVRPQATSQYRLVVGAAHAALARISVAPLVRATADGSGIAASVSPPLSGMAMQLQQQDPVTLGWTTVVTGVTDATGAWPAGAPPAPGTYRVRTAAGHGLVAGLSPTFTTQ